MKICHVCKAECEENAELCSVCGADLTEQVANQDEKEQVILKNPVLVASVDDVVSAEIFKDILSENGIIFSSGDSEENGTLKVVFGGGFVAEDIYVDESAFEDAKRLYEEFLNSPPEFEGEFFNDENGEDFSEYDV